MRHSYIGRWYANWIIPVHEGGVYYAALEKKEIPCPICNGHDFEDLSSKDRYRMGVRTVGCIGCGFVLTNPQPTEAALNDFYLRFYRNYYQNASAPTIEYIRRYGKYERAKHTVDYLERMALRHEGMRILDVGCAEGSILREIGKRSQDLALLGIEPDINFSSFARSYAGCTIFEHLDQLPESTATAYDLIIVNHVLEHVSNPVTFLRRLSGFLSQRGVVYIDVPSVLDYRSIEALHVAHLYHFSSAALSLAGDAAGLTAIDIERHEPPMHPISLRSLMRRTRGERGPELNRSSDYREWWNRIRALDARAWQYFVRQNRVVRSLGRVPMGIVRRLAGC